MTQTPQHDSSKRYCKLEFAFSVGFPLRFKHLIWVLMILALLWEVGITQTADIAFRWFITPAIAHLIPEIDTREPTGSPASPSARQTRPSKPAASQPRHAAPAKPKHQQKQKRNC